MWGWFKKKLSNVALTCSIVFVTAAGLAACPTVALVYIAGAAAFGAVVAGALNMGFQIGERSEKENTLNKKEKNVKRSLEMEQNEKSDKVLLNKESAKISKPVTEESFNELKSTVARQELEIATLKSCLTSYQETNDETIRDNEIDNQRQFQTINEGMIEIRAEVRSSRRSDNVNSHRMFNQNGTQVRPSAEVNAGVSPEGNHRGAPSTDALIINKTVSY